MMLARIEAMFAADQVRALHFIALHDRSKCWLERVTMACASVGAAGVVSSSRVKLYWATELFLGGGAMVHAILRHWQRRI